jgi:NADPH:quinone reductase-like Zn-dependent oxidoreductase
MPATGAVAPIPAGLSEVEAAALPFGALCALAFLEDYGKLQGGERILIVGASGGVGAYAVQVAHALGARVTAVASAPRENMLRDLGAQDFIDYRAAPLADQAATRAPFDLVFDTVGALDYDAAAPLLAQGGRFVPLNFAPRDILRQRRARKAGHRLVIAVNEDTRDGLDRLSRMVRTGTLRPVIARVLPFARIREAYTLVETRHRDGAVVLSLRPEQAQALSA